MARGALGRERCSPRSHLSGWSAPGSQVSTLSRLQGCRRLAASRGGQTGARHWFSALLPSAPGPPLLRPHLRGSSVRRFLSCDLPLAPSLMLSGSAMGPGARPGLPELRKPSLHMQRGCSANQNPQEGTVANPPPPPAPAYQPAPGCQCTTSNSQCSERRQEAHGPHPGCLLGALAEPALGWLHFLPELQYSH